MTFTLPHGPANRSAFMAITNEQVGREDIVSGITVSVGSADLGDVLDRRTVKGDDRLEVVRQSQALRKDST